MKTCHQGRRVLPESGETDPESGALQTFRPGEESFPFRTVSQDQYEPFFWLIGKRIIGKVKQWLGK